MERKEKIRHCVSPSAIQVSGKVIKEEDKQELCSIIKACIAERGGRGRWVTVISAAGLLFIHTSAGEERECIVPFLLSFISLVHSALPWGQWSGIFNGYQNIVGDFQVQVM